MRSYCLADSVCQKCSRDHYKGIVIKIFAKKSDFRYLSLIEKFDCRQPQNEEKVKIIKEKTFFHFFTIEIFVVFFLSYNRLSID